MHEHLFYPAPEQRKDGLPFSIEMIDSGPRLYLGGRRHHGANRGQHGAVHGSILKKLIDSGEKPGPKLRITGPYIGDLFGILPQFHTLADAEDAGRTVDYWAAEGVTSFKAFMGIKPEELKVAVEHAHAKGLKITGHLCAVGFREAAALGYRQSRARHHRRYGISARQEARNLSRGGGGGGFREERGYRVGAGARHDPRSGAAPRGGDLHARGVRGVGSEPAGDAPRCCARGTP